MDAVKKKYNELQNIEKHIENMRSELDNFENKTNEIIEIKKALDSIKKTKNGTEVLFPLADGLFLKGKLEDNNTVLVNVGSGTVVEKNIEEAKKLINDQEKNIEAYKSELIMNISLADEKAYELEQELMKLTENYTQ